MRTLLVLVTALAFLAACGGNTSAIGTDVVKALDDLTGLINGATAKVEAAKEAKDIAAVFDDLAVSMPKVWKALQDKYGDKLTSAKQDKSIEDKAKPAMEKFQAAAAKLTAALTAKKDKIKDEDEVVKTAVEKWQKSMAFFGE